MARFKVFGVFVVLMLLGAFLQNAQASKRLRDTENENSCELVNSRQVVPFAHYTDQIGQDLSTEQNLEKKKFKTSGSGLEILPQELIIYIAEYLRGEDFQKFALTSNYIRSIVTNYQLFFMPINQENAVGVLYSTPFDKIEDLTWKWSREGNVALSKKLDGIESDYSNHRCVFFMTRDDYEKKMYNFEIHLKCLLMNHFLKDQKVQEKLANLKEVKLVDYYTAPPNLEDHIETIRLAKTQGIIVSQKLSESSTLLQSTIEEIKKIKLGALTEKDRFIYMSNFLAPIKTYTEEYHIIR